MRTNFFNNPIFEPGDQDFFGNWSMHYGEDPDGEVARFLEHDEETGWGCEITDNNDRSAACQGFASEEALRDWLEDNGVEIEA